LKANPFLRDFAAVVASTVARPSTVTGNRYNQVSSEFVRSVHNSLAGRGTAADNLAKLEKTLARLSHGGWQ
jgi:trehalose/maltose transport system substrate-binding protein